MEKQNASYTFKDFRWALKTLFCGFFAGRLDSPVLEEKLINSQYQIPKEGFGKSGLGERYCSVYDPKVSKP